MVKKNITTSEFLRVLKRNLGKDYFVFENHNWTLEFRTAKCQFTTCILSFREIFEVQAFCKQNHIEYLRWRLSDDGIEVLK